MTERKRLDVLLVERGEFPSREKAKAAIMAGLVMVEEERVDKAGAPVDVHARIRIKKDSCPYVSRGGLKLEKALEEFDLSLEDAVCIDMGASTGGFTDCMLKHGARQVYAIDVGYGQLDYGLRRDHRVICLEKTNIRYLDPSLIDRPADFISIDVSFISLGLILPVARRHLTEDGNMVCLVKPQFEAGREQVGKKGIVRSPKVHLQVLQKVMALAQDQKLSACRIAFSPVTGAKGNIEYLMHLRMAGAEPAPVDLRPEDVVRSAHRCFYETEDL